MHEVFQFLMFALSHNLKGETLTLRLYKKLKLKGEGISGDNC